LGLYSDQTALAPNNKATRFQMNLNWMVVTIAVEVADHKFLGGSEWNPPVDQMWLLRAGANGDHNPRLATAEQWSQFQKIWGDLAARRIKIDVLAG